MDTIAFEYGIKDDKGWNKVTLALLRKHGGNGLLEKYQNSMMYVLRGVYGERNTLESGIGLSKNHVGVLLGLQRFFPKQ